MALSKHGKESPVQYVIAIDWNWLFGNKYDFSLQKASNPCAKFVSILIQSWNID